MSLINDALKRAAKAQPTPPPPAESSLQMEPVDSKRCFPWLFLMVPLALLFAVGLGVVFLIKGFQAGWPLLSEEATPQPLPVQARELPTPGPATSDAAVEAAEPSRTDFTADHKPSTEGTRPQAGGATHPGLVVMEGSKTNAMPVPQPAAGAAPTFPALKLQGIYYRPGHSSVVINSKTLYKGDRILDAQVIAITKEGVTVSWREETKVLTMR